jgi:hypothetical protein
VRPATGSLGTRAAAVVRGLPDHSVIDRLVRGRVWIPLLGVMLAGIVAMQVEVLKYGANIGRSVEQSSQLTSRNEMLRADVATLANDQRIESLAAGMGMIMPAPTAIGFLSPAASSIQHAVANIHPANALAFLDAGSGNGSVATPPTGLPTDNGGVSALTGTTAATSTGAATTTATSAAATLGAAGGSSTATTSIGTTSQGTATTGGGSAGGATVTGGPTTTSTATPTGTVTPASPTSSSTGTTTPATGGTGGAQLPVGGATTGG